MPIILERRKADLAFHEYKPPKKRWFTFKLKKIDLIIGAIYSVIIGLGILVTWAIFLIVWLVQQIME